LLIPAHLKPFFADRKLERKYGAFEAYAYQNNLEIHESIDKNPDLV